MRAPGHHKPSDILVLRLLSSSDVLPPYTEMPWGLGWYPSISVTLDCGACRVQGKADYMKEDIKEKKGIREGHKVSRKKKKERQKNRASRKEERRKGGKEGGKPALHINHLHRTSTGLGTSWFLMRMK